MADYLTATVSASVTEGVAATVAAQPDDPVDFLGRYLLKLVERGETEAKVRVLASVTSECSRGPLGGAEYAAGLLALPAVETAQHLPPIPQPGSDAIDL